jgi:hypothetical protein
VCNAFSVIVLEKTGNSLCEAILLPTNHDGVARLLRFGEHVGSCMGPMTRCPDRFFFKSMFCIHTGCVPKVMKCIFFKKIY